MIECFFGANDENNLDTDKITQDETDGLDKIEDLQRHENNQVHKTAVEMIECFLGANDERKYDIKYSFHLKTHINLVHK